MIYANLHSQPMNTSARPGWFRKIARRNLLILVACLPFAIRGEPVLGVGTILSTGFDDYSNGALQSQVGWLTAGSGPTNGPNASTATVQTSTYLSPGKAVTVSRAASLNGDRRWARPVSGFPTQRFVTVDWDMRVTHTISTAFGPFFGVETYDGNAAAPYVLGSLGVDATTGDVLYQLQDSGFLEVSGSTVGFDVWNHFRLVLDFTTDSYKGYVNGSLVASTGFIDRGFNLNDFTDADISTFTANGDAESLRMPGSAVFDNFVILDGLYGDYNFDGEVSSADYVVWRKAAGTIYTQADYNVWRAHFGESAGNGSGASANAAVPEPSTMVMLVLAAAGVCSRRRRAA